MKNLIRFFLAIVLISLTLYSQQPLEQPLSKAYIEYMKATQNGTIIQTTDEGYTLGFMPTPYPVTIDLPSKYFDKKDKIQAPSYYDLRNVNGTSYVSSVKNQGSCGSCWAFAAIAAVESREMIEGLGMRDYSEQNVKNCHEFYWGHCDGGNEEIAAAYMVRNEGPLRETDDPYNIYNSNCNSNYTPQSTYLSAWYLPNRRVNGYQDVLKDMIMQYGAIFTAMCWYNTAYNPTTKCYNYQGAAWANHAIAVVGWDDNKDMSSVGATIPGAWICKNSWGTSFGDNGYFYISYQDRYMNDVLLVYPDRMNFNSNGKLYMYDRLGAISGTGYSGNQGYALVKFVGSGNHNLTHLSTWIRGSNTYVTFEVYDNFTNGTLSGLLGSISQQLCEFPGYYTFELPQPIMLTQGNDIYIKVKYACTSTVYFIPVERVVTNYAYPTIESGVSWISQNGINWTPIGANTSYPWDLCIRAYGTSDPLQLAAPTLTFPQNNATNVSLTTLLDWNDVQTATGYDLQLAANSNFENPIINVNNLTSSQYSVPSGLLQNNNIYYWRVRSKRNAELSPWSTAQFSTLSNITPPVLIMPGNLAENVSVTPTFMWSSVAGAENYDFQLSTSPTFETIILFANNLISTQFTINGTTLNFETTYYWRVKAKGNGLTSNWSNAEFKTGSSISPPQIVYPNNQQDVPLFLTLDWTDVNGAVCYDVQVSTNQSFSTITINVQDCQTSQYYINSGILNANTTYYWRVRAKNNSNVSSWAQSSFRTINSLTAPTLLTPSNNSSNLSIQPVFDWSDVPGANSYVIEISRLNNFSQIEFQKTGITLSQLQTTEILLDYYTTYYWRVKSVSGSAESSWSSIFRFTTMRMPTPTLISPTFNARNVSLTPKLDWYDVLGADYYSLQVSTDNNFRNLVINLNNLTESEYNVPTGRLNTLTTYYWRVSATKGTQTTSWSSRWSFTTENLPGPVLVSPSNGASGVSLTPTLSWNQVNNATSYELQVSSNSSFSSTIISQTNLTSTSYNVGENLLNPQTLYYWRVRYRNGNEISNWSSSSFTTLSLANSPTLLSPRHWATFEEINPKLDWEDLNGAVSYVLQVSTNNTFTNLIFEITNLSESEFQIPRDTLYYLSYYYWRVYAITNNNQRTNWSSCWTFRTKPVPKPTLTLPRNFSTGVTLTPTLLWDEISEASSYIVEVSTTNTFANTVLSQSVSTNSYTITSGTLNYGTQYFWRVKTVARGQESQWSGVFNFTTRQAKDVAETNDFDPKIKLPYDIEVFPNPTTDVLNIKANFGNKVNIKIFITDISGRKLLSYNAGNVSNYEDQFYLSGLPGGIYILRVIIDDKYEIIKNVVKH